MEQVAVQNPAALSMLLPALIPCVVNGALGDLHRCEALKLLETLLLKADKKATGLKSRREYHRNIHFEPSLHRSRASCAF